MQSFGRGWNLAPTTANQPTFKVSSTFSKVVESKGNAFGRPAHRAKFFLCKKAQEGRQNSPADCFVVGNPRRGFPGACQRAANRGAGCRTANRGFYLVLKTAVSSRHRLCCNFAGEGGTSPLQRQINQHLKFRPPFQRWWNPKATPLVALRTGRKSCPVKKRRRGDKTVRRTVLTWGTLAGGSPARANARQIRADSAHKAKVPLPGILFDVIVITRARVEPRPYKMSFVLRNP